jgi:predicted metal-binding protein
MPMDMNKLMEEILEMDAAHAAVVDTSAIRFSPEFRLLCEQNKCGHYDTNWMCPPLVGSYDDLKTRAGRYRQCLVFQTVHNVAHSLDWVGMRKAFGVHDEVLRRIVSHFKNTLGITDLMYLGAGPCTYCTPCAAMDKEECRFPDKAVASLESYGIDVGDLVKTCGIPYHHGKNTVSYVGCILFTS